MKNLSAIEQRKKKKINLLQSNVESFTEQDITRKGWKAGFEIYTSFTYIMNWVQNWMGNRN